MKLKASKLVSMEMSRNVQSIVNMIANVLAFGISLVISFFLSPYIVRTLGAEANGFVNLANNFISYAALLRTALNGVGTRYIIIEYNKGNVEKANKYFSSLFFGDLFLGVIFSILSVGCVWKLESLVNISPRLVSDVKILFSLIFANYVFTAATGVIGVSTQVKNKIYLQSIRDIQSYIIRAVILIVAFSLFKPRVFFLGIASFVPSIIVTCYNYYYNKVLTPDLLIRKKYFSFGCIKALVSQGIWNSISSLGTLLLTSLDLLVANLLVGETEMGVLSIAKSMPGVVASFGTTVSGVFFSAMAIDYSKGDMNEFVKTVKQSTRLAGFVVTIPLAFLISYGSEFYSLWQPTLDSKQLQILSLLTAAGLIFYAGVNSVGSIFTITLHVKERSIVTLVTGAVSIGVTLLVVKFTSLGVYAIAGVSSIVNTISMLVYTVPMGAKYIGKTKSTFYPVIVRSLISTVSLCAMGYLLKIVLPSNSWITLIASAIVFSLFSLAINAVVMLDKETRKIAINFVKTKLKINK